MFENEYDYNNWIDVFTGIGLISCKLSLIDDTWMRTTLAASEQ